MVLCHTVYDFLKIFQEMLITETDVFIQTVDGLTLSIEMPTHIWNAVARLIIYNIVFCSTLDIRLSPRTWRKIYAAKTLTVKKLSPKKHPPSPEEVIAQSLGRRFLWGIPLSYIIEQTLTTVLTETPSTVEDKHGIFFFAHAM